MIKVDKDITEIVGNNVVICAEIDCLFDNINQFLDCDGNEHISKLIEELIVSHDESFASFCRLAVRLNEARKRVEQRRENGQK